MWLWFLSGKGNTFKDFGSFLFDIGWVDWYFSDLDCLFAKGFIFGNGLAELFGLLLKVLGLSFGLLDSCFQTLMFCVGTKSQGNEILSGLFFDVDDVWDSGGRWKGWYKQ